MGRLSEEEMDSFLGIHTCGRLAYQEDRVHYPYEPTPYLVLEALFKSAQVGEGNVLVDYGCGKGRVVFYGAGVMGCRAIGVEAEPHLYELALSNLSGFQERSSRPWKGAGPGKAYPVLLEGSPLRVSFVLGEGETYLPPREADRFFFFNPFSQVVLARVLERLLVSYYESPRDMRLFYYYASGEMASYLLSRRELLFLQEIDVSPFFSEGKERERILIFQLVG